VTRFYDQVASAVLRHMNFDGMLLALLSTFWCQNIL